MATRTVRRFLVHRILRLLPSTRLYRIKVALYRWAGIDIAATARVVSSVSIIGPGEVSIGLDTFIGHECMLVSAGAGIYIGANVDIGPRVFIGTGTHEVDMSGLHSAGKGTSVAIVVEDGVWIGAGSLVLPGVVIGFKAVIAAGSVVTRDVPPFVVAAGVPCRVVKRWSPAMRAWERAPTKVSSPTP